MKKKNMSPKRLKKLIKKAGLTQTDIARALELSITHVGNVINGIRVSHRVRAHISKAINKDLTKLWPETYLLKDDPTKKGRPSKNVKNINENEVIQ